LITWPDTVLGIAEAAKEVDGTEEAGNDELTPEPLLIWAATGSPQNPASATTATTTRPQR
jgi:hypothetical protein